MQRTDAMTDVQEHESKSEGEPQGEEAAQVPRAIERLWRFARAHPVVSVIGAATIGLAGGIEMAGGVLIGAGVAVVLGAREGAGVAAAAPTEEEPVQAVRHRTRTILARAPREVKARARAVVAAARGKPVPEQGEQAETREHGPDGHATGPHTR